MELILKKPQISEKINQLKTKFISKYFSTHASIEMFQPEFEGYLDIGIKNYQPNILNFSQKFLIDSTTQPDRITALNQKSIKLSDLSFSNVDLLQPEKLGIITKNKDSIKTSQLSVEFQVRNYLIKFQIFLIYII